MGTRTWTFALAAGWGVLTWASGSPALAGGPEDRPATGIAIENGLTMAQATGQAFGRAARDASTAAEIKGELADREPDSADITVEVNNGAVTLEGAVGSRAAQRRAVAITWQNSGVKRVDDQLAVSPGR